MPALGNLKVWLEMDGRPAKEFNTHLSRRHGTVGCHIASQEGKQFSICLTHTIDLSPGIKPVAKVYIDGVQTSHLILQAPKEITRCDGTLINRDTMRPFQFAALPRSSKANRESSLQRAANIGSIHVVIRLAKVEPIKIPINETQHLDTQEDGKDSIKFKPKIDEGMVAGIKPVHETVRRGTTHYTSFGPTMPTSQPSAPALITPLKKFNAVEFRFKYAPKEIWKLRAGGSIPTPIESEESESESFHEEVPPDPKARNAGEEQALSPLDLPKLKRQNAKKDSSSSGHSYSDSSHSDRSMGSGTVNDGDSGNRIDLLYKKPHSRALHRRSRSLGELREQARAQHSMNGRDHINPSPSTAADYRKNLANNINITKASSTERDREEETESEKRRGRYKRIVEALQSPPMSPPPAFPPPPLVAAPPPPYQLQEKPRARSEERNDNVQRLAAPARAETRDVILDISRANTRGVVRGQESQSLPLSPILSASPDGVEVPVIFQVTSPLNIVRKSKRIEEPEAQVTRFHENTSSSSLPLRTIIQPPAPTHGPTHGLAPPTRAPPPPPSTIKHPISLLQPPTIKPTSTPALLPPPTIKHSISTPALLPPPAAKHPVPVPAPPPIPTQTPTTRPNIFAHRRAYSNEETSTPSKYAGSSFLEFSDEETPLFGKRFLGLGGSGKKDKDKGKDKDKHKAEPVGMGRSTSMDNIRWHAANGHGGQAVGPGTLMSKKQKSSGENGPPPTVRRLQLVGANGTAPPTRTPSTPSLITSRTQISESSSSDLSEYPEYLGARQPPTPPTKDSKYAAFKSTNIVDKIDPRLTSGPKSNTKKKDPFFDPPHPPPSNPFAAANTKYPNNRLYGSHIPVYEQNPPDLPSFFGVGLGVVIGSHLAAGMQERRERKASELDAKFVMEDRQKQVRIHHIPDRGASLGNLARRAGVGITVGSGREGIMHIRAPRERI